MQHAVGLVLEIPYVALAARKLQGMMLTLDTAVYITAVCEFMLAEVLELGIQHAGDEREHTICPSHIESAIRCDKEQAHTYLRPMRRSVGRFIDPRARKRYIRLKRTFQDICKGKESIVEPILNPDLTFAGRSLVDQVFVDPISGFHYHINQKDDFCMWRLLEYDTASYMDCHQRAAYAASALLPEDKLAMDTNINNPNYIMRRRLHEVHTSMSSTMPCIDAVKFSVGIYDLIWGDSTIEWRCIFTADALMLMRDAVEACVISKLLDSAKVMFKSGRLVLVQSDLQLCRR